MNHQKKQREFEFKSRATPDYYVYTINSRGVVLGTRTHTRVVRIQISSTSTWKQCIRTRTRLLSTHTCTRTMSTHIHGTSTSLEP